MKQVEKKTPLVGGFNHISHWLSYFSRWLKPPTSPVMCFLPGNPEGVISYMATLNWGFTG